MSITDGFGTADSLGALPGNVLQGEVTHGGVSIKVYAQECQGLADNGEHGWYHIGFDVVVDATGEIIDSFPYSADSDEKHFGHYKQEQIAGVVAKCIADYDEAFTNSVAMHGTVDDSDWIATFKSVRDARKAQQLLQEMLMNMLMGDFDDDEDEDEPFMGADRPDILKGFDPFAAGPTDEGLRD